MASWPSLPSPIPKFTLSSLLPVLLATTATVAAAAAAAETTSHENAPASASVSTQNLTNATNALSALFQAAWAVIPDRSTGSLNGHLTAWNMVHLFAVCAALQGMRVWKKKSIAQSDKKEKMDSGSGGRSSVDSVREDAGSSSKFGAAATDPGLLRKHSSFKSYTTSTTTYPSIRTFYRPHPQADKLPSTPTPLPLLVFMHGLGGSLAQFSAILTTLVNVAPCFGIDLPGCGRSSFSPKSWSAYTPQALTELLSVVIREHCAKDQGVILIGHSMGCSLSVLLASRLQLDHSDNNAQVRGMVAICPNVETPTGRQLLMFEAILMIPTPIFDLWRTWDRRGGTHSKSVDRFVGSDAGMDVRKLQERFNGQSRTAVWRRMVWGLVTNSSGPGRAGLDEWSSLNLPLFLVGGESDNITKIDQIEKIRHGLERTRKHQKGDSDESLDSGSNDSKNNGALSMSRSKSQTILLDALSDSDSSSHPLSAASPPSNSQYTLRDRALKTSILPAPASHALLYDPATSRTLSGLIHTFLHTHIDARLSLSYQLQHLSTEGKWDVKNLQKWQAVPPVSAPIAGIFRGMKTLREIDAAHSPDKFVTEWRGRIKAVIDISHESPVYDPKGLEAGGIEYHKLPTVSKIPPTLAETSDFADLVDRLRTHPPPITTSRCSNPALRSDKPGRAEDEALIGVHCHYGFNRTGFFIAAYLIQREGFGVQEAIDAFAEARPPGIRHEHFLDQLFVRYCVGLKRAPTL